MGDNNLHLCSILFIQTYTLCIREDYHKKRKVIFELSEDSSRKQQTASKEWEIQLHDLILGTNKKKSCEVTWLEAEDAPWHSLMANIAPEVHDSGWSQLVNKQNDDDLCHIPFNRFRNIKGDCRHIWGMFWSLSIRLGESGTHLLGPQRMGGPQKLGLHNTGKWWLLICLSDRKLWVSCDACFHLFLDLNKVVCYDCLRIEAWSWDWPKVLQQ